SPERVFSGRIFQDLERYPKLVGGLSPEGEQRGVELYRAFLTAEVWGMGSAEAAELTKLAETTYRDINIAFANELARFSDERGLDVERVIAAANSQPFSHIHHPGIAVGGHCIPVYPRFYLAGDPDALLPAAARHVNEQMPAYAVRRLERELGDLAGRRVLILGVTYRGGVKETAFSGAYPLQQALIAAGATPLATDPLYADLDLPGLRFTPWDHQPVDAAIIQADHPDYRHLTPEQIGHAPVLLDGRRVTDAPALREHGVTVLHLGG
ncbi:MAG: nucleotide sugar dehydrogenase, partial [Solirubrobacteraceae bacterium]|nr:nucleotide sugar dehydrogenase [Solirubrobacteraceae bacterium]